MNTSLYTSLESPKINTPETKNERVGKFVRNSLIAGGVGIGLSKLATTVITTATNIGLQGGPSFPPIIITVTTPLISYIPQGIKAAFDLIRKGVAILGPANLGIGLYGGIGGVGAYLIARRIYHVSQIVNNPRDVIERPKLTGTLSNERTFLRKIFLGDKVLLSKTRENISDDKIVPENIKISKLIKTADGIITNIPTDKNLINNPNLVNLVSQFVKDLKSQLTAENVPLQNRTGFLDTIQTFLITIGSLKPEQRKLILDYFHESGNQELISLLSYYLNPSESHSKAEVLSSDENNTKRMNDLSIRFYQLLGVEVRKRDEVVNPVELTPADKSEIQLIIKYYKAHAPGTTVAKGTESLSGKSTLYLALLDEYKKRFPNTKRDNVVGRVDFDINDFLRNTEVIDKIKPGGILQKEGTYTEDKDKYTGLALYIKAVEGSDKGIFFFRELIKQAYKDGLVGNS